MTATADAVRTVPALVARSREQRISEAVRKATDSDGTIDDALTLLALIGTASVSELAGDGPGAAFDALGRAQTLCHVVGVALRRFDGDVRTAPPAALAEVVRDVSAPCRNATCEARVLPWTEACCGYCTDECERDDSDARGRI